MKLDHASPIKVPMLAIGVLILLLAVLVPAVSAVHAKSVLRVPKDFATIQAAVNAASDGDTIQVSKGTYTENVLIEGKSSIRLHGQNVLLQGSGAGIGIHVVDSERIRIQGFIVDGYKTGIVLDNTHHSRIHNVESRFNDNPADVRPDALLNNGIDLIGSSHNLITNVFVHHNGHNGITLKGGSTNNTLRGNTFNDNGKNPDLAPLPAGCGIQLSSDSNNNNTLIDNDVHRNAFGILLSGSSSSGSTGNMIVENSLHQNDRVGIDIRDGSSGNFVLGNDATGNGNGAATGVPGSPNIDLRDQGPLDNTWIDNEGDFQNP